MTEEEITKIETPSLEQEFAELQQKYLRALADGENSRKRMQREKQETMRFGIENAVADFLPAMDNFENALRSSAMATGEVKNWAMGFQMILGQFKEALSEHGITSFTSEGKPFDPAFHEAVETEETENTAPGTILQEFTKGYRSPTRTIRPARVKVACEPKRTKKQESPTVELSLNNHEENHE